LRWIFTSPVATLVTSMNDALCETCDPPTELVALGDDFGFMLPLSGTTLSPQPAPMASATNAPSNLIRFLALLLSPVSDATCVRDGI
jgi:hypothetical protein